MAGRDERGSRPGSGRRRNLLRAGLALFVVAGLGGGWAVFSGRGREIGPLEEIADLPGFLRAGGGPVSRRGDFLIGIAPHRAPSPRPAGACSSHRRGSGCA